MQSNDPNADKTGVPSKRIRPDATAAHLSATDALEQTPRDLNRARYHLREAIQLLDAHLEDQS